MARESSCGISRYASVHSDSLSKRTLALDRHQLRHEFGKSRPRPSERRWISSLTQNLASADVAAASFRLGVSDREPVFSIVRLENRWSVTKPLRASPRSRRRLPRVFGFWETSRSALARRSARVWKGARRASKRGSAVRRRKNPGRLNFGQKPKPWFESRVNFIGRIAAWLTTPQLSPYSPCQRCAL